MLFLPWWVFPICRYMYSWASKDPSRQHKLLSSLLQNMAWHLIGTKLFLESMLINHRLEITNKFQSNILWDSHIFIKKNQLKLMLFFCARILQMFMSYIWSCTTKVKCNLFQSYTIDVMDECYIIHAVMCQNWAGTGPMLAASAQYWPSSGMFTGMYFDHYYIRHLLSLIIHSCMYNKQAQYTSLNDLIKSTVIIVF